MANRRIIFAGSGEFGLPSLRAIIDSTNELVQVITQPDRPAGRGRSFTPTPVGQAAADAGLPLLKTDDINKELLPEADVLVVIAFGQKIAERIVNHPRLGSINLHASLLPKYRGAAPINWAIIRGESVTGNSIIRLAQHMDAGAVIAQSTLPIDPLETAGELHDRLALDGAPLLIGTLSSLFAGSVVEKPQDESLATLSPKLTRQTAVLDFNRPAAELAARIRGLYPWPGCRVILQDAAGGEVARMRLCRARPVHDDEGPRWEPGEVMMSSMVSTPDGALDIIELQPEGGKPMSLADYRRGHRWSPGLKLQAG